MEPTLANRRRYERLDLTEDTLALDLKGLELGRVSRAGGGGIQVTASSPEALILMAVGNRIKLAIFEPATKTRTVVEVEVKFVNGSCVGMQFV